MTAESRLTLFDDIVRTDPRPKQPLEDSFSFHNRVDQILWARVREELEGWFAAYPAEHAADLRSRFRDPADAQHYGAWWELYLFRLLSRLGYAVEVHPALSDTDTRPDFRVAGEASSFLLEATTTFSGIVEEGRNGAREEWILAAIEKAESNDFYVHLEFEKVGMERPKDSDIAEPLQKWLDGLDPDQVGSEDLLNGPVLRLAPRDWQIVFRPLPVKPEARGKRPDKQLLGMGPSTSGHVNDVEKIKGALKKKARKYGEPSEPLVLAVLSLSSPENEDIESALLGRLAWQFDPDNPDDGRWVRKENGFWYRDGEPRAKKVSAVMVGVGLMPWMAARTWPRLWVNPWATHPLEEKFPFPLGTPALNGSVTYTEPKGSPSEVLGLAEDWPGPEKPFESDPAP
jgi:hypothetical protein